MRYRSEEQMEIVPEIEREREGERGGGEEREKRSTVHSDGKMQDLMPRKRPRKQITTLYARSHTTMNANYCDSFINGWKIEDDFYYLL